MAGSKTSLRRPARRHGFIDVPEAEDTDSKRNDCRERLTVMVSGQPLWAGPLQHVATQGHSRIGRRTRQGPAVETSVDLESIMREIDSARLEQAARPMRLQERG